MAIAVTNQPYEILIRFRPKGGINGAHIKAMRVVQDNETILAANEFIETLALPETLQDELQAIMAAFLAKITTD
ncbi:MAG: hypothetical protein ING28_03400 [Roseomonas sp.]|nr:hypothetical protein [Roseomonas sp.]